MEKTAYKILLNLAMRLRLARKDVLRMQLINANPQFIDEKLAAKNEAHNSFQAAKVIYYNEIAADVDTPLTYQVNLIDALNKARYVSIDQYYMDTHFIDRGGNIVCEMDRRDDCPFITIGHQLIQIDEFGLAIVQDIASDDLYKFQFEMSQPMKKRDFD